MAIRRSSSAEVEGLIAELRAHPADGPSREAALARLAVIGARAIGGLLAALKRADDGLERQALLSALERIPDARNVDAVLAIAAPSGPASTAERIAAVRAARPLLALPVAGTTVLDRLTVIALDGGEPLPLRRAALEALGDLPARTIAPVRSRLLEDGDPAVRALADGGTPQPQAGDGDAAALPETPALALALVGRLAADAPLPVLHALLAPARAREAEGGRRRREWTTVRGAIHMALARRASRVGLYDLREAFETDALHPLPPDFVAAVRAIGDASCLEPLARAWLHARDTSGPAAAPWTAEIAAAFRDVLGRERTAARRKHADRLRQRWGATVGELVGKG